MLIIASNLFLFQVIIFNDNTVIIIIIIVFLEFHESENNKVNDYSETDFSSSIDTHKLNSELLKLQVKQIILIYIDL